MSRQVRHRVTAVVLGGLLLGVPLLANGTANAGQTGPGSGEDSNSALVTATASARLTLTPKPTTSPATGKTSAGGVPTLDLLSLTESASTTEPMSENGLLGLLAEVSMVLVLGVSTGVIRAIVSQRAYRTKIA